MHANESSLARPAREARLRHFPVSFFAVVMGLAGFTLAWQRAAARFSLPAALGDTFSVVTVLVFVVVAALYATKLARHRAAVAEEFRHPVRINFFPAISISLLLLAMVLIDPLPDTARWSWTAGTVLHLAFTLYVVNRWIHHPGIEVVHVNPAWFIPVVGNVLVPIAGVRFAPAEVSWFFFSIGIVFWLVLLTIVMYRLFFHAALPERLAPTLFILVAPPAVGFLAYVALTGDVDAFARVLYSTALFFTLLLAAGAARFLRTRFFLSAWAYSFPLAAVTIASFAIAHRTGGTIYDWLARLLLVVLTVVIGLLVARTATAVVRGEICVPEPDAAPRSPSAA
jgi:tellurite resistance protein